MLYSWLLDYGVKSVAVNIIVALVAMSNIHLSVCSIHLAYVRYQIEKYRNILHICNMDHKNENGENKNGEDLYPSSYIFYDDPSLQIKLANWTGAIPICDLEDIVFSRAYDRALEQARAQTEEN